MAVSSTGAVLVAGMGAVSGAAPASAPRRSRGANMAAQQNCAALCANVIVVSLAKQIVQSLGHGRVGVDGRAKRSGGNAVVDGHFHEVDHLL